MKFLNKRGLLQAILVALYCCLVGVLFWKADSIFGNVPNFFGPVLFLLLFSLSALVCGLAVFLTPYKLFMANKKKEAVYLVISTTCWLFLFVILTLSLLLVLH